MKKVGELLAERGGFAAFKFWGTTDVFAEVAD